MFHVLKANGRNLRLLSEVRDSTVYTLMDSATGQQILPKDGVLAVDRSLNVTLQELRTAGFHIMDRRG